MRNGQLGLKGLKNSLKKVEKSRKKYMETEKADSSWLQGGYQESWVETMVMKFIL